MIEVTAYTIETDRPLRNTWDGRIRQVGPTTFRVDLKLIMDEAGFQSFCDAMEAACPGFRKEHAPSALNAGAIALPSGVLEAEFDE